MRKYKNVDNEDSRFDKIVSSLMQSNKDISKRLIKSEQGVICILFIKQLCDRTMLADNIIKPLILYCEKNSSFSAEDVPNQIVYVDDCKIENDKSKMVEGLLNGLTIIILSWDSSYLLANIKSVEKKPIGSPELTYSLRGPKDCFTENLDSNLSLIRYRIKDPELKIQLLELGRRTKARVAVVYIDDIVNSKIVDDVLYRLNNIDTDGIIESGELQTYLLNNKYNLLPQIGLIERSDMACGAMLEGKVIIITEGSGIALIAPKTFNEFFASGDDIYDNMFFGTFMKFLRLTAFLFSFTLGSLYIAVVSFHTDLLPAEYVLTLATLTSNVPFNATTSVLLLEAITEILREALLRIPKHIGSAIGIVGAIIIGQAAISSGIFSPFLLILVSLSLLSSFVAPDYSIMNAFRILKFVIIFLTSMFGLIGFSLGICFIMSLLVSVDSFGIPYFAPFAPFNLKDFIKSFVYSKRTSPKRPDFLQTKDNTRG